MVVLRLYICMYIHIALPSGQVFLHKIESSVSKYAYEEIKIIILNMSMKEGRVINWL